jgi:hypothetical protein
MQPEPLPFSCCCAAHVAAACALMIAPHTMLAAATGACAALMCATCDVRAAACWLQCVVCCLYVCHLYACRRPHGD